MTWLPCGGCEDFYCTRHDAHVYDCECPEIQDWETDPYMTTASDLARALAARRQRATIICEVCGKEAEVWARKSQQARTCSNKCRQALWRKEHKPEKTAE